MRRHRKSDIFWLAGAWFLRETKPRPALNLTFSSSRSSEGEMSSDSTRVESHKFGLSHLERLNKPACDTVPIRVTYSVAGGASEL